MVRRLVESIITSSEMTVTVAGTLAISLGINFFTNLKLWSSAAEDFYDVLCLAMSVSSVYLGCVLFRFIDNCRLWSTIRGAENDLTKLAGKKKDYIKTQMELSDTKISIMHLYCCFASFTLPAVLTVYKIGKEWSMVKINLCALLFGLVSFFGCDQNKSRPQPQAVIGYQEIALYRHLFTAKAKGYFDQEGINVDIKPFVSANQMMQGMIAGELDGTGLTNLQVALTVEGKDPGNIKFVNFLVWRDKSFPDYILARSGANISSMKDLEGHSMGLHPGSAVKAFNKVVLEHFGIDLGKGTYIELDPNTMQAAVVAGRVDALNCMDPVATNLVEHGQCKVLVANPMQYIFDAPVPISGTALTAKFLQERPDDARRIMRALERAINYMREPGHEDEIAGYIAQYTPIEKELALKMNPSEYWTLSEIDRGRVQALANRFQELKIVEKAGDVNAIIVPTSFLPSGGEAKP